jgi:septum formation protein
MLARRPKRLAERWPRKIVLGADTLVAFEGRLFGKPSGMDEALEMLEQLNGRAHDVFSGVWLVRASSGDRRGFVEATRVHFRRLSTARLREYLCRIRPTDKAGGYAAQEDKGELIERFEGSFTNVIGLPMERLAVELSRLTRAGAGKAAK